LLICDLPICPFSKEESNGYQAHIPSLLGRGWIAHGGWRIQLVAGSRFTWPVMPFNPYTADGAAPIDEATGVLRVPLDGEPVAVTLEIIQAPFLKFSNLCS
jgi:hypothetical protein